jgi:hypothetical protein
MSLTMNVTMLHTSDSQNYVHDCMFEGNFCFQTTV